MRNFGKNLTTKSEESSLGIAPGFTRQPRLAAGLLKKLLARQLMLDGNLREKKPALRMETDQQAMMPELDGFGSDWLHGRQQRDFDAEPGQLIGLHGREPWIFQRRAGGTANNGLSQRLVRFNHADTALKPFADVQGHENGAALREDSFAGERVRKFAAGDSFDNRGAG